MGGKTFNVPEQEPDLAGLDERDAASAAEARPLPWFAGEAALALTWVMAPVNQFTKEAPAEVPGKK